MKKLIISLILLLNIAYTPLNAQELLATVAIQSNKVDNQVDPKVFIQLQSQLKDFLNQRKWSNDVFGIEQEKALEIARCSFWTESSFLMNHVEVSAVY